MPDKAQRILSKIDFSDGCWNWAWSLDKHGYSQVRKDGTTRRAHRVVYEILVGDVAEGLDLDHLCRNRKCVRPEHLEPVTRSTNLQRGILWQSKKSTCPNGHPYDMTDSRGARRCRRCYLANMKLRYQRRKSYA